MEGGVGSSRARVEGLGGSEGRSKPGGEIREGGRIGLLGGGRGLVDGERVLVARRLCESGGRDLVDGERGLVARRLCEGGGRGLVDGERVLVARRLCERLRRKDGLSGSVVMVFLPEGLSDSVVQPDVLSGVVFQPGLVGIFQQN
ncbi:hypothetical protein MRB53_014091 [Persea americana]|uniref:Uncharacterized protein n=1 Tax=Persea americana TaxID=3435 RepID=A0ACC2K9T8_PERAE|nr:hypothetical protein MRB53_014091 [Persea americana]